MLYSYTMCSAVCCRCATVRGGGSVYTYIWYTLWQYSTTTNIITVNPRQDSKAWDLAIFPFWRGSKKWNLKKTTKEMFRITRRVSVLPNFCLIEVLPHTPRAVRTSTLITSRNIYITINDTILCALLDSEACSGIFNCIWADWGGW
jgi:hypothetical protein